MKPIRHLLATMLAGAALAAAGLSASAADDSAAPPPPGPHGWHHHGGPMGLLNKLDLTADQKQQIKDIMTAARPQMQNLHQQMQANMQKLQQTQPTDPNYTSITSQVSQTHGSLSAQMMAQRAEVRAQVFKVLTPAQQAQLTTLEAQLKSQIRSRKPGDGGGPPPAQ